MDEASRLTLVLMAGLPGTGKSTLAGAIGRRLGWPILDKDTIKSTALDGGVPESVAGRLSYDLLQALATDLLAIQRLSVIVDSPAGYPSVIRWAEDLALRADATLKVILCQSDRATRSRRLTSRTARRSQWTATGPDDVETVLATRPAFFPADTLLLEASGAIETSLRSALAYLLE